MNGRLYADVVLPLSLPNLLTYEIPFELQATAEVGKRVIVQLGKRKFYSALVRRLHQQAPEAYEVKKVLSIVDDSPIVNEQQFKFWEWIAEYYLCNLGDVMTSALPAALKLHSDEKGEIADRYKPLKEVRITVADEYTEEDKMREAFEQLEKRSPKQLETLMTFMKMVHQAKRSYVLKNQLHGAAPLIKKGILKEEVVYTDRVSGVEGELQFPTQLSNAQQQALDEVRKYFSNEQAPPVLMHGVTSSGKTEIYIHLIDEMLKQGKHVLYLLPEIALTSQMVNRLKKHFGKSISVYHSRQNSNEKVDVWKSVARSVIANEVKQSPETEGLPRRSAPRNDARVILGARSALFLPFSNLGLIIVDEEHDSSYKQQEPSPRYHARDSALVLGRMYNAKLLLGSATPSLETYYNVKENKYHLVNLHERFGNMDLPEIVITDVADATRKKQMKSHFTPMLINSMKDALTGNEQVILFQNRRGFAPVLECNNCGWIPQCKNCTVTLTYHKQLGQLKCHYCGYAQMPPSTCQRCGDYHLEVKGFGTEKIEEEMAIFFPDARIARLDLDSTRTRNAFQRIINDFEERKVDVLVGTQMVTKGLDFDNVSTVGIINADQMLNFPDFRAHERSFQLMSQVSGRSGRKLKRGKVIIQTHQPDHWVIRDVVNHDYPAFYERDLFERRKFSYPPLTRLIEIMLKHKDEEFLHGASFEYADALRKQLGNRVVGPHMAMIARIKNLWQRRILVKVEREASSHSVKEIIKNTLIAFNADRKNHTIQVVIDVDPI